MNEENRIHSGRKRRNIKGRGKTSLRNSLEIHCVYFLFRLWTTWVRYLPVESLRSYGAKLGTVAFYLLGRGRRIALNNLHLALGREKSQEETKQFCREVFKNIGMNMMETLRFLDYDDNDLRTLVRIDGKEHLDQALRQGKGVIALTAHLGNFPLMSCRLLKDGYPLSVVTKLSNNPKIVKFITSFVESIGLEFIPDKPRMTCVARCLNVLKENRILIVQIDLNAPVTEAWVDFFGYLVPTFKGPAVFSLRTGAPILPIFIVRNADQQHRITIYPPYDWVITENNHLDINSNIARLTKMIEAIIRKHPEQWWWVHRKFKRARDVKTGQRLFS